MRHAYWVQDIRAAEGRALASEPASPTSEADSSALMRRAAFGLSRSALRMLGRARGSRVVLLVGPGSNGGDALWAGVELRGRGVDVAAIQCMAAIHPAASRLSAAGGRIVPIGSPECTSLVTRADLVIDGVLGIGGRAGLGEDILALARSARVVLAVDVPSGIDADTGEGADAIRADVTVTFGAFKPGLLAGPGRQACGALELIDIGLQFHEEPALLVPGLADAAEFLGAPAASAHKYSRGTVGVIAGSGAYPGAAVLAVGGARASGAGMVRAMPGDGFGPGSLGGSDVGSGVVGAFSDVVLGVDPEDPRLDALVIGPGVGGMAGSQAFVAAVMGGSKPLVVDADGLALRGWQGRSAPTCITPHAGEARRVLAAAGVQTPSNRVAAAQELAERFGCVAVLKGPGTIVAAPGCTPSVDTFGTSALATPGTGDILAGLIGGLFATHRPADNRSATDLARAAVTCHSVAGEIAARSGGPVRAPDILRALPSAIAALRLA